MTKGKVITAEIVGQFKNCACGEVHEGFCDKCKTKALSTIVVRKIEDEREVIIEEWLEINKDCL